MTVISTDLDISLRVTAMISTKKEQKSTLLSETSLLGKSLLLNDYLLVLIQVRQKESPLIEFS